MEMEERKPIKLKLTRIKNKRWQKIEEKNMGTKIELGTVNLQIVECYANDEANQNEQRGIGEHVRDTLIHIENWKG